MLGPVAPTQFDWQFSLLGIPVRVSPWFWLMAAMLGWDLVEKQPVLFSIWVAVVFLSILVHEFGHALTAKAFGYPPRVLLYHFGGLAFYQPWQGYTTARALLITAAGPAAGFVLCGVALVARVVLSYQQIRVSTELDFFLYQLFIANLFWSVLNLMPVFPLDGGRLLQDAAVAIWPRQGVRLSLMVSVGVGALLAIFFFTQQAIVGALMFGMLAGQSLMELQNRRWG